MADKPTAAETAFSACEMLHGWDDFGGDAPDMLQDAVDEAREALRLRKVEQVQEMLNRKDSK
ncbi:MAG TPA: hypothetical protein VNA25_22285 [Phycisphaerae bacterium]|nr:hypothetical protein [Phycisphaerae bacterium]